MVSNHNYSGVNFNNLERVFRKTIQMLDNKNYASLERLVYIINRLIDKFSDEMIEIVGFKGIGVDLNREDKVERCKAI